MVTSSSPQVGFSPDAMAELVAPDDEESLPGAEQALRTRPPTASRPRAALRCPGFRDDVPWDIRFLLGALRTPIASGEEPRSATTRAPYGAPAHIVNRFL